MRLYKKLLLSTLLFAFGCNSQPPADILQSAPPIVPPPASVGGFDAARAYEHVRHLVELGPRPPGSDAIHAAQSYISAQLKSFGCQVEEHDFQASSPIGNLVMKNIIAKAPGTSPASFFTPPTMTPSAFQTLSARMMVAPARPSFSNSHEISALEKILLTFGLHSSTAKKPKAIGPAATAFSGPIPTTLTAVAKWPPPWPSPAI